MDQLKRMEGFFFSETEQEGVTVIKSGGDKGVDEYRSGMRWERRAEPVDVSRMKICRTSDVVDM